MAALAAIEKADISQEHKEALTQLASKQDELTAKQDELTTIRVQAGREMEEEPLEHNKNRKQ